MTKAASGLDNLSCSTSVKDEAWRIRCYDQESLFDASFLHAGPQLFRYGTDGSLFPRLRDDLQYGRWVAGTVHGDSAGLCVSPVVMLARHVMNDASAPFSAPSMCCCALARSWKQEQPR